MARKENRIELKPVEDLHEPEDPVVRLHSDAMPEAPALRLRPEAPPPEPGRRLDLPQRGEVATRTHEPGIEALIEPLPGVANPLEGNWGSSEPHDRHLPWGWFILIAVIVVGAVVWSLTRVKGSDHQAETLRHSTQTVLNNEAQEEREASALIDNLEEAKVAFFKAATPEEMIRVCRQPERVRPLMENYYRSHPLTPGTIRRTRSLAPQTIDGHGNFWVTTVELESRRNATVLLEVLPSGEVKVDWETSVCYQPMDWTAFALERPMGQTLDFRVYAEKDNLFSHEFADSKQWVCFQLTARDSIEPLYGYARAGSDVALQIAALIDHNPRGKAAMILRVTIPEGLRSHRGVVIEKLLNPSWMYLQAPAPGS